MISNIPSSYYQVQLSTGTGDCLVNVYQFFHRLQERGIALPLPFPETICYEHHFPRGWYYFESDSYAGAGENEKSQAQVQPQHQGESPPTSPQKGGKVDQSSTTTVSASTAAQVEDPATSQEEITKKLVKSSVLRQLMGLPNTDKQNSKQKLSSIGCGNKVLMKRSAKECDSTSISKVFSPSGGKKKEHYIGCEVVTRDHSNGNTVVKYLDRKALASFLMNTPEQCVLSRVVHNRRKNFDVIVSNWTPSVFSIEHRVNVHSNSDSSIPSQQRGDTTTTSLYTEVQTCPLLASRVREAIQRMVWLLHRHERMKTLEVRATFRQDSKMKLWLLWVDVLRLVPVQIARPLTADDLLLESEKVAENKRAMFKKLTTEKKNIEHQKSERKQYGCWPSFTKEKEVNIELLMQVEDILDETIRKAQGRASTSMSISAMSKKSSSSKNMKSKLQHPRSLTPLPSLSSGNLQASLRKSGKKGKTAEFEGDETLGGMLGAEKTDGLKPMLPMSLKISLQDRERQSNAPTVRVHFEEIEVTEEDIVPLENGSVAPPASPRTDESIPVVETDPIPTFLTTNAHLMTHASFLSESPIDGSLSAHSPGKMSTGYGSFRDDHREQSTESLSDMLSKEEGSQRRNVTIEGNDPEKNGGEQSSMIASIRRMQAMVIAKRKPGKSIYERQEKQRARYSTIDGHVNDPFFQSVNHDVQASRRIGEGPARRSGGLRRVTRVDKGRNKSVTSVDYHLVDDDFTVEEEVKGLSVQQRLDYNALRSNHFSFYSSIDDLAYQVFSQSMQQRGKTEITWDLPAMCPMPEQRKVLALGFHPIEEIPVVAATTTDPFFCVSGEINIKRAFLELKKLVMECCLQIEEEFLSNCNRQDVLGDNDSSRMSPVTPEQVE